MLLFIFLFSIITANSALLEGVNNSLFIFNKLPEKVQSVLIEGCGTKNCLKSEISSNCSPEGDNAKWFCHLQGMPDFYRFVVKTSKDEHKTKLIATNSSASEIYSLHLEKSKVQLLKIHGMVFQIAMQEMLENVWDSKTVKAIREIDPQRTAYSSILSDQKFELTLCENENCNAGLSEKVICPLLSRGLAYLGYDCKRADYSRYARIKFLAKDKVRESDVFELRDEGQYLVEITSSSRLKLIPR